MAKSRITIIGLGLIGGSIGLALRRAKVESEIVGHDREPLKARKAKKLGAVDRADWNLISACEGADMVIIATPLMAIKETLEAIAPYLKPGCLVTDTASVKGRVMEWAQATLPESVSFVGGDPIVRGAGTGLEAASADLFKGAPYCLCPSPNAAPEAVQLATDLVGLLGAEPYFLDPVEHDGLMAGVDHLPFLLSATLLGITTQSASWREMRKLAGGAFESATHFASSDPSTYRDTCLVNGPNIVRWIDACLEGLRALREIIVTEDAEKLEAAFEGAMVAREGWLRGKETGNWEAEEGPERPSATSFLAQLFGLRAWGRKPLP